MGPFLLPQHRETVRKYLSPHSWLLPVDKYNKSCQQELAAINKGTGINHVQAEPNSIITIT